MVLSPAAAICRHPLSHSTDPLQFLVWHREQSLDRLTGRLYLIDCVAQSEDWGTLLN